MIKKFLTITAAIVLLTSCGEQSEKVESLKRSDKTLNCSDIQLEINEADFYKKQAADKKRLGIKSIVMPLGYIDTFMSADEAIEAADARIQYLNRIYDIKHCDGQVSASGVENEVNQSIQRGMQAQPIGYSAGDANGLGAPIYGNNYQQR